MTRKPSLTEWNHRRAVLSHDLLKNQIFPGVSKLCKVISGHVYDPLFLEEFSDTFKLQVSIVDAEIEWLVFSAHDALSPRQLFNFEPLVNIDVDTKSWLPDAIHNLWIANIDLSNKLKEASDVWRRVKDATDQFYMSYNNGLYSSCILPANKLRTEVNRLVTQVSNMSLLIPYGMLR